MTSQVFNSKIPGVPEVTRQRGYGRKYLQLLDGTFVFKRLTPFFRNVRRELSKMPKIYALDLGLRSLAVGNFNDMLLRGDRGEMVENFVFNEL